MLDRSIDRLAGILDDDATRDDASRRDATRGRTFFLVSHPRRIRANPLVRSFVRRIQSSSTSVVSSVTVVGWTRPGDRGIAIESRRRSSTRRPREGARSTNDACIIHTRIRASTSVELESRDARSDGDDDVDGGVEGMDVVVEVSAAGRSGWWDDEAEFNE